MIFLTKFKETEIGKIPEDWEMLKLSDLTFKITKGTTPTTLGGKFVKKGINFIKVESLNDNGTINQEKVMFIDEETNTILARSKLQKNDILYTIAGTIGKVSIVTDSVLPANTNQAVAILRPDLSKIDLQYLYYVLVNPEVKRYLLSKVVHAVQPNLSLTEIGNCPVPMPNAQEQKAIAKILSDLDSKIELNNKMNATLEAMAQAIFKHWFIDFEFPDENGKPYKSSGGKMVDSKLGKIPEGWEIGFLRDLAEVNSGKRPSDKSDIRTEEFSVELLGASSVIGYVQEALYTEPIIVIGRVGTHGIVQRINRTSWPSDNTLVIRSGYYEYVFQCLKRIDYNSLNIGSTQPLITQTQIKNHEILMPEKRILAAFESLISKLYDEVELNSNEITNLILIRDSLLPKLMSGQIRVPVEVIKNA